MSGDEGRRFTLLDADTMTDREYDAWRAYFRRHGVDLDDVAIPGYVVADDDARTLQWLTPVLDADGRTQLEPGRDAVLCEPVTLQLESRALPFPDDES